MNRRARRASHLRASAGANIVAPSVMSSRFVCLRGTVPAAVLVSVGWLAASLSAGEPLADLAEQNRRLREQVQAQQGMIDELRARLEQVAQASERHERQLRELDGGPAAATPAAAPVVNRGQDIRITAEAGFALFNTGSEGQFPKAEFRVDDPVISIEAPITRGVYFFSELKLLPRETNEESFELGEIYVDFENVSAAWGQPGLVSLRAGRLTIPFGEEYQVRGPIANPLISHSLSDIWGVDEGIELYGRLGPTRYVVAVQNGGVSRLRDFNADKAIAGRVSWDPQTWLRLSASAMRTGEIATTDDKLSEVWFGNGFFRSLGPAYRTSAFWATLMEGDASARWARGHVNVALGQARYDDSDPLADNARRLRYGYVEWVQRMGDRLQAAARVSAIRAPGGYPLAGWATLGRYFFSPTLTERLQRTSLGLAYRISDPLIVKFEYSWESGRTVTGLRRAREDFFGSEIAVRF